MSQKQIVEELKSLEELTIRGHLSIEDLVRRQIDRCNLSMSGMDPSIFEANVRALLSMLPSHKRAEVMTRENDFNTTGTEYEFQYNCNMRMGTPDNPVTSDGLPPNEDRSNVISPVPVEVERTDYEKLYEIIIESLESVGLTWNIEAKFVEHGAVVDTTVPPNITQKSAQAVVDVLLEARKKSPDLTFSMIVETLRDQEPPTPVFEDDK